MKKHKTLLWLIFSISTLIFSLGISWQINKTFNFTYSLWYQALNIEQHIATYAPQNKYGKTDFIRTNKQQRVTLFQSVVTAINNNGVGLENITYQAGNKVNSLFTQAEVLHLQDVSTLVSNLVMVWLLNLIPLTILTLLYLTKKLTLPSLKLKLATLCMFVASILLGFLLLGFKKIFYYFHTLVFPDNHQWFFYYQESLMSTFMKAPDLFAAIAINLAIVAVFIMFIIHACIQRLEVS